VTRLTALLALAAATGCAYYNAMWSAERFAKDARRLEARGQEAEARAQWARAAAKAESVIVHHPRSRWADDALVLKAEGLARAGTCTAAAPVITKARNDVTDVALRERVALAAAHCALAAGRPVEAETALAGVLDSAARVTRHGSPDEIALAWARVRRALGGSPLRRESLPAWEGAITP